MSDERVPIDDILEVYAGQDEKVQVAVSHLMSCGGKFLSATFAGTTPSDIPMLNVVWSANPTMAIFMLKSMIDSGTRRFGEVWLDQLLELLTTE